MRRWMLALAALASVAGCATTPHCDPQAAAAIAMEEGVVRDGLAERFPECAGDMAVLTGAYDRAIAGRCVAEKAWQAAYLGNEPDALCRAEGGRLWIEASRLGAQLAEFEQRQASLEADIERLEAVQNDPDGVNEIRKLRIDAQRMTREIEQIRGIALIRGWIDQDVE